MTNHRPKYENWAFRLVTAIFLLFVGGLTNQFLNIPAQQAHQDEQIAQLRIEMLKVSKQVYEVNTPLLNTLKDQHMVLMERQAKQTQILDDLSTRMEDHERKSRARSKK